MASTEDMATNIMKLDRFDGGHFLRWQKRVHFLLTSIHLVYVINTCLHMLRTYSECNEWLTIWPLQLEAYQGVMEKFKDKVHERRCNLSIPDFVRVKIYHFLLLKIIYLILWVF